MIKLVTVSVADLTPVEYKMCSDLTLRGEGTMQGALARARARHDRFTYAIMAWENGDFVGWCLFFKRIPVIEPEVYSAHFYVRQSHRRRGIGTKLIKKAYSMSDRPLVTGVGRAGSNEFFAKHHALVKKRWYVR